AMASHDIAALLRQREIDILIDLNGHTEGARTDILAGRPAPIQLSYMGYPGSMGADFFDGIIADAIVVPPEHESHYSEKVLRIPECYWVNDSRRAIGPTPT